MELRDWHIRLEQHFEQLRKDRSKIAPGQPVFGLEHGLDVDERKDLSNAIRNHIKHWHPSKDHRLAWIVYASEIGYLFAGDEYWQTFEERTPGWNYDERSWLRDCFEWFHEQFDGANLLVAGLSIFQSFAGPLLTLSCLVIFNNSLLASFTN